MFCSLRRAAPFITLTTTGLTMDKKRKARRKAAEKAVAKVYQNNQAKWTAKRISSVRGILWRAWRECWQPFYEAAQHSRQTDFNNRRKALLEIRATARLLNNLAPDLRNIYAEISIPTWKKRADAMTAWRHVQQYGWTADEWNGQSFAPLERG